MLPTDPYDKLIYMSGYNAGKDQTDACVCPYREGNFAAMLTWMQGYYDATMDWGSENG